MSYPQVYRGLFGARVWAARACFARAPPTEKLATLRSCNLKSGDAATRKFRIQVEAYTLCKKKGASPTQKNKTLLTSHLNVYTLAQPCAYRERSSDLLLPSRLADHAAHAQLRTGARRSLESGSVYGVPTPSETLV